jgi:antitoxin component HigA of HigAB toxin-antitoxin module
MPAIAERLPAKYLVKAEAAKVIASREQHQAYIQRLLELQRKAHRSAEETETAKLLVVLIADYEAKQFSVERASGVEVPRELMDANGLRQKDLADDLGGESLLDASTEGKLSELVAATTQRIRCVGVDKAPSMLIRPDACIAWAGEENNTDGLEEALRRWFIPTLYGSMVQSEN